MSLEQLQSLIAENSKWFESDLRETETAIATAEQTLGVTLPHSLKWLLTVCGYSVVQAVPNLEESVHETLRLRTAIGLPKYLLLWSDLGDAGVVLLDTTSSSGQVVWTAPHNLEAIVSGNPTDEDTDLFTSFADWVQYCLDEAIDDAEF